MKTWPAFHRFVLTSAIGCPLPVVNEKLVEAAREFCQRTHAWQETDEFVAAGGASVFTFEAPVRSEAIKVVRATVSGKDLSIYARDELPSNWQSGGADTKAPALYHFSRFEYLLIPQPAAGEPVAVTVSVQPSISGEGVGDDLFEQHAEHIAAGALYRILKMPHTEWQDLTEAQVARAEFESGVHDAANRSFMHTSPQWRRVKSWG